MSMTVRKGRQRARGVQKGEVQGVEGVRSWKVHVQGWSHSSACRDSFCRSSANPHPGIEKCFTAYAQSPKPHHHNVCVWLSIQSGLFHLN